jgi:hypothetical protein
MLLLRKSTQMFISLLKPIAFTSILILTGLIANLYLTPPVLGSASAQAVAPDSGTRQGMMDSTGSTTSTMPMNGMSMAEMGAMMDEMMAQMSSMMASMPMTGTASTTDTASMSMPGMMSMGEMGQMMQMMGMMHQKMGQMQMMMGAMMSGDMMSGDMMSGDMMSNGMMGEGMGNVTPEATVAAPDATATVEPSATEVVSESTISSEQETAASNSGHPTAVLAAAPQSATAGAITVKATPLTTGELLDIAFTVTLETHSVELDFNLAERATLTVGEFSFPATSWVPDAPSGHHVEGTLHFTLDHPAHAALANVDAVTLELQDIDGQLVTLSFAVE